MSKIALAWDPYNHIGTVFNSIYPDGAQFSGEPNKPVVGFEYDSLEYNDEDNSLRIYTDIGNNTIPLTNQQVEAVRSVAFSLEIPSGQELISSPDIISDNIVILGKEELKKTEYLIYPDVSAAVKNLDDLKAYRLAIAEVIATPEKAETLVVPDSIIRLYSQQHIDDSFFVEMNSHVQDIKESIRFSILKGINGYIDQVEDLADQASAAQEQKSQEAASALLNQAQDVLDNANALVLRFVDSAYDATEYAMRYLLVNKLLESGGQTLQTLTDSDKLFLENYVDDGIFAAPGLIGDYGDMPVSVHNVYDAVGIDSTSIKGVSMVINKHLLANTFWDQPNDQFTTIIDGSPKLIKDAITGEITPVIGGA